MAATAPAKQTPVSAARSASGMPAGFRAIVT
jgi:hypothetical protein